MHTKENDVEPQPCPVCGKEFAIDELEKGLTFLCCDRCYAYLSNVKMTLLHMAEVIIPLEEKARMDTNILGDLLRAFEIVREETEESG